jgi:hypothetical protein
MTMRRAIIATICLLAAIAPTGASAGGISDEEIRVVVLFDSGSYHNEVTPEERSLFDLDEVLPSCPQETIISGVFSEDRCDHVLMRATRALGQSLGGRFQTYGRRVHLYAYFSKAFDDLDLYFDALDVVNRADPFAVIDEGIFTLSRDAMYDAFASRGVLVFTSNRLGPAVQQQHAPHVWTTGADTAHTADLYADYICSKVAGHPATHTPDRTLLDRPRVFGLYRTVDPARPDLVALADAIKPRLASCGVEPAVEATFSHEGFIVDGKDRTVDQAEAVAAFRLRGVTTVLWLGGVDGRFSHAAAAIGYFPEIVLAGDGEIDSIAVSAKQNPAVWRNAWTVRTQPRIDSIAASPGGQAAREASPTLDDNAVYWASVFYPDHLLLFTAVEAAGSTPSVAAVDGGLHSLPHTPSTSPYVVACFFDIGDYSCTKDATEAWWDSTGQGSGQTLPGCFRLVDGGARFLAGTWTSDDAVFADPSDPCDAHPSSFRIRPPSPED